MSRFPAPDDSPSARQPARSSAPLVSPSGRGEALARKPVTGFRLFRPPLPARVRLCEGRPTRVWIRGRSGRVVAASGPWRTSGDWWREAPWRHDEWDLEIRFDVPAGGESSETGSPTLVCRLYYDEGCKEWFVRGSYD